jgi:DNA-binding XRE family transcriptional regulator
MLRHALIRCRIGRGAGHVDMKTISPAQCRAARAFLGWPRHELAARAGISLLTVANFESEANKPRDGTMQAIVDALTFAGIEFLDRKRPGVRFNSPAGPTLSSRLSARWCSVCGAHCARKGAYAEDPRAACPTACGEHRRIDPVKRARRTAWLRITRILSA